MTKSDKIREYFRKHPDADVTKVAAKFEAPKPMTYKLRKQIADEGVGARVAAQLDAAKFTLTPEQVAQARKVGRVPVPEVPSNSTDVDETLDNRAQDYGKFIEGAEIMQKLKRIVHNYIEKRGTPLAFDQCEAIDMIIHKLGRIINGNPDKVDSWVDIAGYAKLVADRLQGNAR